MGPSAVAVRLSIQIDAKGKLVVTQEGAAHGFEGDTVACADTETDVDAVAIDARECRIEEDIGRVLEKQVGHALAWVAYESFDPHWICVRSSRK